MPGYLVSIGSNKTIVEQCLNVGLVPSRIGILVPIAVQEVVLMSGVQIPKRWGAWK